MNDGFSVAVTKIAILCGIVLLFSGLAEGPREAAESVTIPAAILIGSGLIALAVRKA